MSKCIIGHEYALVYELEILPDEITTLGDMYENGTLDESDKWFMDEEQFGANRPLLQDFIDLANKNEEDDSASICFLISLNEIGESENSFQLKLLKAGVTIVEGFQAPETIWKMEEVHSDLDWIELKVYHGEGAAIELDSSYYELQATYESVDTDVSIN